MSILSNAVLDTAISSTKGGKFTVTSISPCSYATYLNYQEIKERKPLVGRNALVVNDGWNQERDMIAQLKNAGFELLNTGKENQLEVILGKLKITGHCDGLIKVPKYGTCLLEMKAMNRRRFSRFCDIGLEPSILTQVQLYLLGLDHSGVERAFVYAKNKETCEPFDRIVEPASTWALDILGETEEIILGNWIPSKVMSDICPDCRRNLDCWDAPVIDTSDLPIFITDKDRVDAYIKAKVLKEANEVLMDLIKEELSKSVQQGRTLFAEGTESTLRIQGISSVRNSFSKEKFIAEFGANKLHLVMEEKPSEFVRITRVKE